LIEFQYDPAARFPPLADCFLWNFTAIFNRRAGDRMIQPPVCPLKTGFMYKISERLAAAKRVTG